MIMIRLKASRKFSAFTLCITAHAGACQERAVKKHEFVFSQAPFLPLIKWKDIIVIHKSIASPSPWNPMIEFYAVFCIRLFML